MASYIFSLQIIMGTVAATMGTYFFIRERGAANFRYFILVMGISCGMVNIGYGLMGISKTLDQARFWRNIGLIGVIAYLIAITFLLFRDINLKKGLRIFLSTVLFSWGLAVMIVCTRPDADRFIKYIDYITYEKNNLAIHRFEYSFIAFIFACLFVTSLVWVHSKVYKREKYFAWTSIIGHYLLALSSVPDMLFNAFTIKYPSFSYCLFYFIAYEVFLAGSYKFNGFTLNVSTISNKIFQAVDSAILVYTPSGELALANNKAIELLNIDGIHKQKLDDFFKISRQEASTIGEDAIRDKNFTRYWETKNEDCPCKINCSVEYDNLEEPFCIFFVITDISNEERLIDEANRANEAKSTFLANMSHEIRTPINVVLGMNEMVMRETKEPEIKKYALDINNAGRTLLSIINDILDISKIEAGRVEIINNEYESSSLISDCYNMIILKAEEKSLKLLVDIDEKLPKTLLGDETRIRQVIINLLNNAVKYTDLGEIRLAAKYESEPNKDGCLVIDVTDTGRGMTKESMEVIFDSFTRIDGDKNYKIEGTGLGLSITKNLVEMMGGTIEVASTPGVGSTFLVKIPQAIVDATPIGEISNLYRDAQTDVEEYRALFKAPRAKILVVDDLPMNLTVFCALLKETKLCIDTSESGEEALKKIYANKYDLIFMDHMMPDMDGVETLSKIKDNPNHPNTATPIIVLTANAIYGVESEYRKIGFDDYISKPIRGIDLEKMILKHLPEELVDKSDEKIDNVDIAEDINSSDVDSKEKIDETSDEENKNDDVGEFKFPDIVNVEQALSYCAGDKKLLLSMLETYVNERRQDKLCQALAKEDFKNYQLICHGIKSTAKMLGLEEVSEKAKEMEFALKLDDDKDFIRENHENFVRYLDEIGNKLVDTLG